MLLDKLPNGKRLKLWKKADSDVCLRCSKSENTEHLLFSCPFVNRMWKIIEQILKINITWKRLVLGFHETTDSCINIETVLAIILYYTFKNWVILRNEGVNHTNMNILKFIKSELEFRHIQQQYMEVPTVKYNMLEKIVKHIEQYQYMYENVYLSKEQEGFPGPSAATVIGN